MVGVKVGHVVQIAKQKKDIYKVHVVQKKYHIKITVNIKVLSLILNKKG